MADIKTETGLTIHIPILAHLNLQWAVKEKISKYFDENEHLDKQELHIHETARFKMRNAHVHDSIVKIKRM